MSQYEEPEFKLLSKEVSDLHLKGTEEASRENKEYPGFCIIKRKDRPGEAAICFAFEGRVYSRFLETGELIQLDNGGVPELYENFWRQRCRVTGETRGDK